MCFKIGFILWINQLEINKKKKKMVVRCITLTTSVGGYVSYECFKTVITRINKLLHVLSNMKKSLFSMYSY